MKATEINDWKSLSSFVFDRVSGAVGDFTDEEYEVINKNSVGILKDIGSDLIGAQAKKIMNLNFLDKKVSFKVFEKLPNVWVKYFGTSIDIAASEFKQYIMSGE